MSKAKMLSVGDVAFEFHVHERTVVEFAEEGGVPTLGREFIFDPKAVRRFEAWLGDQEGDDDDPEDDESAELDDDGEDDGDEDDHAD